MHRFLAHALLIAAFALRPSLGVADDSPRPNILFLSVDDMSCDSVGVFGCPVEDTTPHIDRLAGESLRFHYAHVQVGNCMPSRNVMFSGRYPQNNRVEGFYQVKRPEYPVLADLFSEAGYFTAIRGKVNHSTPYTPYRWDLVLDELPDGGRAHPKDVASYYRSTRHGIEAAAKAEKPFCLLVNVSDPHKPFYTGERQNGSRKGQFTPSRVYTADEVVVPGFLPDVAAVRQEVALYYSTVRRADDCVGQVLKALDDTDAAGNTVVMFLSDHGMPLPFAKTALWHHSTRTPWMVRWPGVTKAGAVDRQHMISAIDLLPTLLDIAGIKHPEGLEGRSFAPVLKGERQSGREFVVKVYNENSGGFRNPMRSVQTKRFGYLFNPWSNGERKFRTATTGTASYRAMRQLAASDPNVAARLKLFDYGVVEEFYDYENDPDALNNLIDDPEYADEIQRHRELLGDWMRSTNDHALSAFLHRDDPEVREAYVAKMQAESDVRRANRKRGGGKRKNNRQRGGKTKPPAGARESGQAAKGTPSPGPSRQPNAR